MDNSSESVVVLLTGATGFLGKVVLEELIRRRPEFSLREVLVLIRPTKPSYQTSRKEVKAKVASSRFHDEVASSYCFAQLPSDWTRCVQPISGDLEKEYCGLDASVYEDICQSITHIIHCAACIQFDLPLADAIIANVHGTLNLLQLAKACSQLQRLICVSTAFVTPARGRNNCINEELAPLSPWSCAQQLLTAFSAGSVTEKDILRLTGHPNTYTLSKCIAEHLIIEGCGTTPVTIARPSIITAALERPYPGWTDGISALSGLVLGIQDGAVCALEGDPDGDSDLVPVDLVVDFLINESFALGPSASSPPIGIAYCTSGVRGVKRKTFSVPAASYFQHTEIRWLDYQHSRMARLYRLFWQDLPLHLTKTLCRITGDRKGAMQLTRAIQNINKLDKNFAYFQLNSFEFLTSRPPPFVPCSDPEGYLRRVVFRGTQTYMMRCAREQNRILREKLIAGKEFGWGKQSAIKLLLTSRANTLFRLAAALVDIAFSRMFQKVTFDQQSFHDALENYNPGLKDEKLLILPTHRSYVDFVICPYLFYHFPGLGVKIPRIAAQDEFSKMPIIGSLMRRLGAFYVQRGIGRPDPRLDEQVRQMVAEDEHILFFLEGTRSRSRRFLPPHRGLLRSLQSTGNTFRVLPISISYERVPEEASFIRELQDGEKSHMSVLSFIKWTFKMIIGHVKLGRVHIKCGKMLALEPETDVRSLSYDVMDELRANTVVTTYHLEAFVSRHRQLGLYSHPHGQPEGPAGAVKMLRKQLEARGATVLDGCLQVDEKHPVSPILEASLRNQWEHILCGDVFCRLET